jgi:hypothetical protein
MWRYAILLAACAPTWTKPAYRPTALAEARHAAALDHGCPESEIRFKRDATEWMHLTPDLQQAAYEPGGVVGTFTQRAPRWTFVFDVCGEQRVYMRPVTDSPLRDPSFVDLYAPTAQGWTDL